MMGARGRRREGAARSAAGGDGRSGVGGGWEEEDGVGDGWEGETEYRVGRVGKDLSRQALAGPTARPSAQVLFFPVETLCHVMP